MTDVNKNILFADLVRMTTPDVLDNICDYADGFAFLTTEDGTPYISAPNGFRYSLDVLYTPGNVTLLSSLINRAVDGYNMKKGINGGKKILVKVDRVVISTKRDTWMLFMHHLDSGYLTPAELTKWHILINIICKYRARTSNSL